MSSQIHQGHQVQEMSQMEEQQSSELSMSYPSLEKAVQSDSNPLGLAESHSGSRNTQLYCSVAILLHLSVNRMGGHDQQLRSYW